MIEAVARGIPADVTVRLRKVTVTVTVKDAIFLTFADTLFAFSVGSDNRSSITGKGEAILMDEPLFHLWRLAFLLLLSSDGYGVTYGTHQNPISVSKNHKKCQHLECHQPENH